MSNITQKYFGLKELTSVVIRAQKNMTIGNHFFEEGEPVLYFEKLQVSNLSEKSQPIFARGGKGNYPLVVWENFHDVSFAISEGVLSKMSFSILSNSQVFQNEENTNIISVPKREIVEVKNKEAILMETPKDEKFFLYELDELGIVTRRLKDFSVKDKKITINETIESNYIAVDYYYDYVNSYTSYILSNSRIQGLFTLEGKAYFKDENSGLNQTFLFEMPRIKITSNMDIIMGEKASPNVSVFNIIGLPVKENNQLIVSKMHLLSDNIDTTI